MRIELGAALPAVEKALAERYRKVVNPENVTLIFMTGTGAYYFVFKPSPDKILVLKRIRIMDGF
jgi:hypothetical protein